VTTLSQYTMRGYRGRPDLAGMVAVRNARAAVERSEGETSVDEMAQEYEHLQRCDPDDDIRIVEAGDEIVGYARTAWEDVSEGHRLHWVVVEVSPAHPDLEGMLFDWVEGRAGAIAAQQAVPDARLAAWTDESTARAGLLRQRGFDLVRYGATLVRPHLRDIPSRPLPEGVEVRPVIEDHLRPIWEADIEAFRDHRGYVEQTDEDWKRFLDQPFFDPTLWRVAWAGDEVVGQVRSFIDPDENERHGRSRGWTEDISTARGWRGQGIASALICLSLRALAERGMTEAALGVDTENPTGAFSLYRSLGFEDDRLFGEYEKLL
jgi:mycothiol synthase